MSRVDVDREASLVQPSRPSIRASSLINILWISLFRLWSRVAVQPATTFVLLSLVFGVVTVFVVPPLRGPDEIAHFLRIYSYTRGELVPTTEAEGRKGILVNRELYNQLRFFKDAGEWFARDREEGIRYGAIMALYREASTNGLEVDQPTMFMPFAGTEGYNPVAYIPSWRR
jgi:hypothetical protein